MSDLSSERDETLAGLAASRAEIRRVFEPSVRAQPATGAEAAGDAGAGGGQGAAFPRSRTMKLLMSGRGMGTVGAVVGGLLLARPRLALRLLRLVPVKTIGRVALIRGIGMLRSRAARD